MPELCEVVWLCGVSVAIAFGERSELVALAERSEVRGLGTRFA
jgi:hypothetical protein